MFKQNDNIDGEIPVFECFQVWTELFKLYYDNEEFKLNSKADAHEALDKILGIIHGWYATKDLKLSN